MSWWTIPAFCLGGYATLMLGIFQGPRAYRKLIALCTPRSALTGSVALTVSLLENSPEQWASDGYYLSLREVGVSIWIANGASGLGLSITGENASAHKGVPLTVADREVLWKAIQQHQEWLFSERTRAFAEKVANHARGEK